MIWQNKKKDICKKSYEKKDKPKKLATKTNEKIQEKITNEKNLEKNK